MNRRGKVLVQDRLAGYISETSDGYEFRYTDEYIRSENPLAVSLTLPVAAAPYESSTLFPFFDGLIPEGWLLDVVERNWKLDPKDRFGILLVACRDCIGDVNILAEDEA